MDRTAFREAVFERDHFTCVYCDFPAEDAHHLIERRLWPDGGYHVDNGVSLCAECHLKAERTDLSVELLRSEAGIQRILVPPQMERDEIYDKWGNVYLTDGRRARGPLFYDESVQRVLADHLDEFTPYVKYPRTLHLPWSPGATSDDRVLARVPFADREVVVTEKLDGENTTLYRDHVHARSIDSRGHPSRTWVKNLWSKVAHEIPDGWRICGENLQAQHAIAYRDLPGYFLVFSIWDERNRCLSWDDTVEYAELLGLPVVPMLWRGSWVEPEIEMMVRWAFDDRLNPRTLPGPRYGDETEGYVIRVADGFDYADFQRTVAKYVRAGHVNEGTQHWFARAIVPNELASGEVPDLGTVREGRPA